MSQVPHTTYYVVAALYKFVQLSELEGWRHCLRDMTTSCQMIGTILLADEGINGTVSAAPANMSKFITWLTVLPEFSNMEIKDSTSEATPYQRMKVLKKLEKNTMAHPDI